MSPHASEQIPVTMVASGAATDGAIARDNEDFETAILAQVDMLNHVALRLTGHVDDAEDLVQETVARALACRAQFRPNSNVGAWLITIERSLYYGTCRRRRRAPFVQSLDDVGDAVLYGASATAFGRSAEHEVLRRWAHEEIMAALDSLPLHYRMAVLLSDVVGLSYAEMAHVMDCAPGTVMSRLHRGRALLRQALVSVLASGQSAGSVRATYVYESALAA